MDRTARFALRSVLLHRASTAIPSRSTPLLRSLQTSARSTASQPSSGRPSGTLFNFNAGSTQTPTLQQLRAAAASAPSTIPLQASWPWYTLPSSSPDEIVLERTVFARPPEQRPPLLLFAAGVWGLFLLSWLTLPDAPKRELTEEEKAKIELREKNSGFLTKVSTRVTDGIFNSSQPILMGGITLVLFSFLVGASRIVTKLSMVQIRPAAGKGEQKTFLKLTSVGHEMVNGWVKPREMRVEDCKVYFPNLEKATTVRLQVLRPDGTKPQYSLDRLPYALDFREMKGFKDTDKEVVISLNRVEHIFGRVGGPTP
ncbi:hypothetical protein CI109_100207 [Kwoniella shandongensis]|uniref:Uncharacterized protein n=1 Tax=Kwoniella shandongensis TaxID=1734106 RepID=A0A5M6BRD4_9TREE|nr:uncharacterized protein CI109_006258 [Kwoniella shandongensis]KAA5525454.1 hypothetical protein CI109_006258 [Kwoniella shandongensis]